jgi:hypothetical protein
MPLSLAATYGISIDFFSSCYSDVSVRKGSRSPKGTEGAPKGSPYEVAFGNPRINRCLLLPEAYRSLPRPSSSSKPSHPPYSVSASDGHIFDERLRNLCTTVITKQNIALLRPSIEHSSCRSASSYWLVLFPRFAESKPTPNRNVFSKEVIRPQVPLRPPCYDFSPVAELGFDGAN